jgi:L-aspartate oxidase
VGKSASGRVYLDISHLPADTVKSRFPTIYRACLSYGVDITRQPIPVAPAAHYMMGGVKIDTWGRTNIQGLHACGEVACSGVHGANRLASNSLLDTLVFAQRLVASSLGRAPAQEDPDGGRDLVVALGARPTVCASMPALSAESLKDLMWRNVGLSRHGSRLLLAARILHVWQRTMPKPTDRAGHELHNMVLLGRLMAEAALLRQESRGAHFREDFPETSPQWEKHIVLVKEAEVL